MSEKPDQFDELEAALRQLPLRQPSAALDARIRRLTSGRTTRVPWIIGIVGGSLAAAASLLIAFWPALVATPSKLIVSTAPAEPDKVQIVGTTEQWLDEGIVGYASDGPVRQYRFQSVEQLASADQSDGRTLYLERVVQVVSETY